MVVPQAGGIVTLDSQRDIVTINVADHSSRLVGVLGGGIEKTLSASGGFRLTARLALGSNRPETTIDASPATPVAGGPGGPLNGFAFSNAATTVILPTTLSGPSLTGFKTFIGKGTRIESTLTVGYFFRF